MNLIHPSYFPNIINFSFIADKAVCWEVEDNYQKQTLRNRIYICNDRGLHLMSIPIIHVGNNTGRQLYKDVHIDNSYPWQRQHWRTLETAYRTSPFFEFYEDDIKPLYTNTFDKLLDFNLKTIETVLDCLQLEMPKEKTKVFKPEQKDKTDLRFLSSTKNNVKVKLEPYVQVFGDRHDFIPNLSILDLLFNVGPNSVTYLKETNLAYLND